LFALLFADHIAAERIEFHSDLVGEILDHNFGSDCEATKIELKAAAGSNR
jgi:hypothetical protein